MAGESRKDNVDIPNQRYQLVLGDIPDIFAEKGRRREIGQMTLDGVLIDFHKSHNLHTGAL